jgi:NADP-reducing hydrogenase subunit HndC
MAGSERVSGQFERHLFVCTDGKTCPRQGSRELFDALRERAKGSGLGDRVRVNRAGCFSQCGHGPMAVVYPEAVWYAALRAEDAARLVDEHLVAGRPVEALRYRPAGPGKQICPPGDERIPPVSPP